MGTPMAVSASIIYIAKLEESLLNLKIFFFFFFQKFTDDIYVEWKSI